MLMESSSLPLQLCRPQKLSAIINRWYSLLHIIALLGYFYYRISSFLQTTPPSMVHLLVFASELLLSLIWLFHQAYLWWPVSRTVFPERLPKNKELPSIDVFICAADPKKEPPLEVMNTVLSAMALDYPSDKLHVYLSDDGNSSVTLLAMREACVFSRSWLPFCRKFGIKSRCPKAYFSNLNTGNNGVAQSVEYDEEKQKIKRKYELFTERIKRAEENVVIKETDCRSAQNHPSIIEVINVAERTEQVQMPLLVYVSRQKRPSQPHHFKAGALNVLVISCLPGTFFFFFFFNNTHEILGIIMVGWLFRLRVSSILSNSPYILVLDCDMYCNDPSSARQAMCFHLDTKISPSLAFVQFPQKFHTVTESDIYDSHLRTTFMIRWPGMDGLQGPMLSGTGFYMKREALYGNVSQKDLIHLKQSFGPSNEFIMSLQLSNRSHNIIDNGSLPTTLQLEAQLLASCTYEEHTLWGKQVGFLYNSMVEDYFTGFILHCKGWKSIFCNPSRPAFLGTATTKLNDTLVQGTRWNCGSLEVTLSKFCPPVYGLSKMSVLQTICYGYYSLQPLYSLPLWCLATLPQLCLLNGIPIYPKVRSSWFIVLVSIFVFSLLKQLEEVLITGGSVLTWWNEQRFWMIKSVTAYSYGILDAILKHCDMRQPSFLPTDKVADDEQMKLYQKGKFNFQMSASLLAPLVTLVIWNMISFAGGIARMVIHGDWDEMFSQFLLSFYILVVNYPIIEGMTLRKDKARIPCSVALLSLVFSFIFLCLGSMALRFKL